MIKIIIILSLFLESIISNFISINTDFFNPLFVIVSIIFSYQFIKEDKNLIIFNIILGLVYDIAFTNTLFLNASMMLILTYITIHFYNKISINIINNIILTFILILIYRIVTYLILLILGYINFDFLTLLKSIYSSLILNIGYMVGLYFITNYISYKFKINKRS